METIDLMTAMILGLSINTIMAVIILITARKFPKTASQSMKYWAIGLFFLAGSYLIFGGFIQTKSTPFDLLGNLFVVAAIISMSHAVSIFLKVKLVRQYQLIMLLTSLALLLSYLISQNIYTTVLITCLGIVISISVLAKPMFMSTWKQPTSAKIIIFTVTAVLQLLLIIRGIDYFLTPRPAWGFSESSMVDFITIIIAVVGPVITTFGFMLMHQERAYKELARLASVDSLTQIYNRHATELKARVLFKQSIQNQTPIAVMLIDLDKFKLINDQFGHAAGDEVLFETAQIIRKVIGKSNVVGRFGGEEFFVILPGYDLPQAQMKSQQLLAAFREHGHGRGANTYQITASIGVVERKSDETSFSNTLRRADLAMYDAKNSGRDQAIAI